MFEVLHHDPLTKEVTDLVEGTLVEGLDGYLLFLTVLMELTGENTTKVTFGDIDIKDQLN